MFNVAEHKADAMWQIDSDILKATGLVTQVFVGSHGVNSGRERPPLHPPCQLGHPHGVGR